MTNPYLLADRRQSRARARLDGPGARLMSAAPILAGAVAVWLGRDVYTAILGPAGELDTGGYSTLLSRVSLLVAAGLSLSTYDAVIRGPDRGIVDLHPVLAQDWLRARLRGLARDRWPWLVVACIALTPLLPNLPAFILGTCAVAGAWLAGMGVGLGVNLAAPRMGSDPRFQGLFDAIRGPNPRLQAALLYAPGVALAVSGVASLAGTWGAARLLQGGWEGVLGLLVGPAAAVGGWRLALRTAPSIAGIGAVLGEIDAAWAATEHPEEARAVYLEWAVRFVPAPLQLAMRKELRHLWRGHRGWVTASWGLALLIGLSAWTRSADGPDRYLQSGGAALAAFAFVGVQLGARDPAWLDAFLRVPHTRGARVISVFLASQPLILIGAGALAVRQGAVFVGPALRLECLAAVLVSTAMAAGLALRGRGGLVYAPVALVAWAAGVAT